MFFGEGWTTGGKRALVPSAFIIKEIFIEGRAGVIDVAGLVTEINIDNSLHLLGEVMEITIVDAANILQDYKFSGNEKVTFIITRQDAPYADPKKHRSTVTLETQAEGSVGSEVPQVKIPKEYWVVDYPAYGRGGPNIQVYKLKCTSAAAIKGKFKKVCKGYKSTTTDEIQNVFSSYCGGEVIVTTPSTDVHKGIIPNISPFDAIEHLLKIASDGGSTPYYLWESFDNKVYLKNLEELAEAEPIGEYKQRSPKQEMADPDFFDYIKHTILEVTADLGYSVLEAGMTKAVSHHINKLDISQKLFRQEKHSIFDTPPPAIGGGGLILWSDYDIDGEALSSFTEISEMYQKESRSSYEDFEPRKNSNSIKATTEAKRLTDYENLHSSEMVIKIPGDSVISPGDVVDITLPISSDPQVADKRIVDEYLSGKYMIVSARHTFSKVGHFILLKIKRGDLI